MPEIVGIRFKRAGKVYDFDATGLPVEKNDLLVVESDFGLTLGKAISGKKFVETNERPLKPVIRIATKEDLDAAKENKKLEKEAYEFCLERIKARGIQMKLIGTESTIDRKRIIFFFTADGRVDFRELVKDLAARFRTRIEMRQVGVRDESKMLGGIGICGRELCCCTFLSSFEPVAIKMAKDQELVLNVAKLSGVCGRLMCCLRYEFDGDPKEIAVEDEPIPEEYPVIAQKSDTTMASILSTITEEDKEPEATNRSNQDRPIQRQKPHGARDGKGQRDKALDIPLNKEVKTGEVKNAFEKKGFRRRKHFKRDE